MGQKVNYNKNNKTNKLKIAGIAILSLLVVIVLIDSVRRVNNSPNSNQNENSSQNIVGVGTLSEKYTTLQDLLKSYNCTYEKEENTNGLRKIYLKFDVGLYTGNMSNESHFLSICKAVANFIDYKNFELIDKNKNIDIEVDCEKPNITSIKINGDLNYYLNHDSDRNKNLSTNITNFTIQSRELQDLINNNWDETKVNLGTKDSSCNGYNIYFDEGINSKIVSTSIYNVIFTEKYRGQVAGNLTVNSTPDQVKASLGNPTFEDGFDKLYGYVGENNYLFFDFENKEISVYPVKKVTPEDEKKLKELVEKLNENQDIKAFSTDLIGYWLDYDVYDYDSDYVDLRYTLKGVRLQISNNSLKNGIFIYQNYSGNRNISELENVYIQETDFVFESEKERADSEYLCRSEEGDFEEDYYNKYLGENFSVRFYGYEVEGSKGAKFYSRTQEYPDSELDRNLVISSYIWYDSNNFVYSVNDDGIYVYNCVDRVNTKLSDVTGEIEINSAENGQIIYNENEVINVSQN